MQPPLPDKRIAACSSKAGGTCKYTFPADKLQLGDASRKGVDSSVVLVACGSFNPPTPMHLSMFDIAVAELREVKTD